MIHIYGIKNCNTVKKALTWLTENNKPFTFHDFKKENLSLEKLQAWEEQVEWEKLVNKKGTTWRKLSPEQQAAVVDAQSANKEMIANNSLIKRPVIELGNTVLLGFDEELYQSNLQPL